MEKVIDIASIVIIILCSIILIKTLIEIIIKKRGYQKKSSGKAVTFIWGIVYMSIVFTIVQVFINKWPSLYDKFAFDIKAGFISLSIFIIYFLLSGWFSNGKLRIITISLIGISGAVGYSVIMFIIDKVIKGKNDIAYFSFFVLAMVTYVYSQKITRNDMIEFANKKVIEMRKKLFFIVLDTRQEKFEKVDIGRVYTCINNDMEILSNNMRDIITVLTNALTILACFGYLAYLNLVCFIVSLAIFVGAVCLQTCYVNRQEKIFIGLMKAQQKVYNFLDSLTKGHKELVGNRLKKEEYKEDFTSVNREYTDARIFSEKKKTNTFILGQSLLYIVIGFVIFLYPVIFKNIGTDILQSYALVFLFIISPVSYLVDLLPRAVETSVSYKRVNQLISELERNAVNKIEAEPVQNIEAIELKDVCYRYNNESDDENGFGIGPINASFEAKKIHFIIGSNGSGKSTLVKVITGLYEESSGDVLINGKKASADVRCDLFSSVYSDYYLFKKLYGISVEGNEKDIEYYLKQLRINDKLTINGNELSTVDLSSGQRKRVALLLCYLDNKDIYVFDEWAADQDVVFREFFYRELLPTMKAEGKTIIAITHDDRYFDVADQIIHMDFGKVRK